ncbi:MAG: hypothetical protein JWR11_6058, partial [Mycobacterium sp.]|nr:hypothetical protein [Mycobacterium sp.]
ALGRPSSGAADIYAVRCSVTRAFVITDCGEVVCSVVPLGSDGRRFELPRGTLRTRAA